MRSKIQLIGMVMLMCVLLLTACITVPANDTIIALQTLSISADNPEWLSIPVLNVKSGEQTTLADFKGKTVVVEGMAVWCGECFYQQTQAAEALSQLNSSEVIYVSLDIDPNGEASLLAEYAQTNSFNWTFVRGNAALMEALITQFGGAVTVPSNMPIFFISPSGQISELYTGGHTASELITLMKRWSEA